MRPLTNWFRRKKLERDLSRELHYHFDRRISDLERSGLSATEARRQATLELRGVAQIQEEVRDIWFTRWLRDVVYDLRFSFRSFLRTPSFTVTAVLSLMLGIGATTAIYSLVDQVLLHALPVRQPERLVLIDWKGDEVGTGFGSWNLMSYPICRDLDRQKQFFEGVFCRALIPVDLSTGGDPRPATAEIISGNYFPVLGVGPALGQVLANDDDHVPNPVAVVSYDFWQTQFGGASDVVGRKVLVNRHPLTVIGVAAPTFRGIDVGEVPSLWIPASESIEVLPIDANSLDNRRSHWVQVLGRLNEGMTLQRAQVGLQPWFKAMLQDDLGRAGFPVITPERRQRFLASSLQLTPAPNGHSSLRRQMAQPLWILFAVTVVLLGLACLNVSGLFLARASAREREIATRLALGASGGRLGRQLLVDSLLVAFIGGVLGIAIAPLAVRALIAFLPNGTITNALQAGINSRLLLFAFAAIAITGILSGLAPVWQSARRSLTSSLRERGGTSFGGVRLRKIIVTAQVALALTLVVGAALFARSLNALMAKGPGFITSSMVSFSIEAVRDGYSSSEGQRVVDRIDKALRESPTVQTSAVARFALLTGGSWNSEMTIFADRKIDSDGDVNLNAVTPRFFDTMGIKIVAGRNFNDQDVSTPDNAGFSTPDNAGYRSAIVSESFVKRYLGGRDPLGVRISQGTGPNVKPTTEIVGVMSDFSYRGIREDSEQAYFPFYESEHPAGTFYAKVRGTPESSFASLRAIVRDVDPTLPMTNFHTLDEQVNRSLNAERMLSTLSGSFSILALLLSLVGLYGVMSFVVTRRTREIGIRLALGATPRSAIWLVLRDALAMILSGIAIGLPFIWAFGRLVQSQLYQVKPWDPAVITVAVLALGLAGLCATLFPAYRASRVNPTEALRAE